jgi:hypothetical protein
MSHRAIRHKITIAVFAVGLALAGGAQAGGLYTGGGLAAASAEVRSESLLTQAWSWMTALWNDLFGAGAEGREKESTPLPPSGETTGTSSSTCTNPQGCSSGDAGWGIDPNG